MQLKVKIKITGPKVIDYIISKYECISNWIFFRNMMEFCISLKSSIILEKQTSDDAVFSFSSGRDDVENCRIMIAVLHFSLTSPEFGSFQSAQWKKYCK